MPNDPVSLDLETLRGWIGRQEQSTDTITPRLEASLRAVFDRSPSDVLVGEAATPSIHWCLAPPSSACRTSARTAIRVGAAFSRRFPCRVACGQAGSS